eukprot:CAMPEP_0197626124 /NCGR_PEP_ID=MMETSP1338-20131121/5239_1 /TAXON_ID=43686 ORGANISM="Pelagodinium beii, Strain RCC1491" /NCGR_SAMPLE_ID=MMETSP1338 /ASSEMBLY_ACC=CAM_ASM_000754 /LENGTH=420 /DNA_ID=CAMNT_0043196643 /DNA_START=48 /DNA_END=1307 /DNA_ORIENTATION=+
MADKALPLNFGKRLAHTDKVVRDRGFKTLKKWLQSHAELERLEFMKLWKGLYFGMWMADKRPVQQELAVNVALLLNDIPREKRNLWIDTFWETMRDAWEKLDVHRINKYMLFLRIVLAESFKDLRVGGWQLEEVKSRAEILAQSVPKLTNSAPSVGISIQLTRILWDELLPQLGQSPKASQEVVMAFLEPFISLAEWSYVDSLVRSIHDNIIKRAPPELRDALTKRVLEGAAKPDIPKKSREALYDTADELEKASRLAADITSPLLKQAVAAAKSKTLSPAATKASAPDEGKKKKAKAKKKTKKEKADDGRLVMSPLMLPKAAVPAVKKKSPKKSLKKRKGGIAASASAEVSKVTKKAMKATKASSEASSAGTKRKVSFDLNANKVVKFREKQPVASGRSTKKSKAKSSTGGDRRTALKK